MKAKQHDISIKSITSFIYLKSEKKIIINDKISRATVIKCWNALSRSGVMLIGRFFHLFSFSFVALIPGRRLLLVVPLVLFQLTLKNYLSRTLFFCMDSVWAAIMPPKIRLGNIKAKPFRTKSFGLSASSFPSHPLACIDCISMLGAFCSWLIV